MDWFRHSDSEGENEAVASPQTQLQRQVATYLALPDTDFAIMIDGEWGSGKTFSWKKWIAPYAKSLGYTPVYVSLYGTASVADIDTQLFIALFPRLSGKGWQATGKVGEIALRYFRVDAKELGAQVGAFFSKKGNLLLCFDDLERSKLSGKELFGYINRFVEHERRKVLVLCNEKEARAKDSEYDRTKEKLVGHTFQQHVDIEAVVESIVQEIEVSSECKEHFQKAKLQIAEMFRRSESGNIRSLKRALGSYAYLDAILRGLEKRPDDLESVVLKLILAISLEIKKDEKMKSSLQSIFSEGRYNYIETLLNAEKKSPLVDEFAARYYGGSALNTPNLRAIFEYVCTGALDIEQLISEVTGLVPRPSTRQATEEERLLDGYWKMEDTEIVPAAQHLIEKLSRDEIASPHFLLKVLGVLLQLSKSALIPQKVTEIAALTMESAERLHKRKALNYQELESAGFTTGFSDTPDKEYKDVKRFLVSVGKEKEESDRRVRVRELLATWPSRPDEFIEALVRDSGVDSYRLLPVLKYVHPEDFAQRVLRLTPSKIIELRNALEQRYKSIGNINHYLADDYNVLLFLRNMVSSKIGELERTSEAASVPITLTAHTLKVLLVTINESLERLAGQAQN